MSRRQLEPVPNYADLVDKYREKYPKTERKALKKLILSKYTQLNSRSLDRHLSKAFSPKQTSEAELSMLKRNLAAMQPSGEEMNRFWREVDQIKHEFVYGYPSKAYDLAFHSYSSFPSAQREIAKKIFASAENLLLKNKQDNVDLFLRMGQELKIKKVAVSLLLQKLPKENAKVFG